MIFRAKYKHTHTNSLSLSLTHTDIHTHIHTASRALTAQASSAPPPPNALIVPKFSFGTAGILDDEDDMDVFMSSFVSVGTAGVCADCT